eukprot:COSAG01_NODE_5157_length_4446_cov_1.899471_5_plen_218_part_00
MVGRVLVTEAFTPQQAGFGGDNAGLGNFPGHMADEEAAHQPPPHTHEVLQPESTICFETCTSEPLDCGHHFHPRCLAQWTLAGRQNCDRCPTCRQHIAPTTGTGIAQPSPVPPRHDGEAVVGTQLVRTRGVLLAKWKLALLLLGTALMGASVGGLITLGEDIWHVGGAKGTGVTSHSASPDSMATLPPVILSPTPPETAPPPWSHQWHQAPVWRRCM